MIPGQFDYVRPASLDDALAILRDREGEAKLLSGGYSLIPLIKLRLAQPELLVDMRDLSGLDGIVETDDELRIGARATHRQIHDHPVMARYPMMREVAGGIGDPQVRNWGTIGGSIAHADPASDWPAVMLARHAHIVCRDAARERSIRARDFFIDTFQTALEPTEVLTEIRMRARPKGGGGAYKKLERKVGDFATVGVAVAVELDASGRIDNVGIGITGVSPSPYAAEEAEDVLEGQVPADDLFRRAATAAAASAQPTADVRGPVDYKRAMVAEMTVRAIRTAVDRAMSQA
jgi:aerobic carbon-monoxide dehydrogenase medium subunit